MNLSTAYYIYINVFCICILIEAYVLMDSGKTIISAKNQAFKRLILLAMLLCVSDAFAWYFDGKLFYGARAGIMISNILYFCAITWIGTMWLDYVLLSIGARESASTKSKIIRHIPCYITTLLILVTPYTGFMFTVDGNNIYARGNGTILHWIVSWGYLAWATVRVAIELHQTKSKSRREALNPLLLFIAAPVIAALIQMLFYGITALQSGITFSVIMVTYWCLQEQISADSLTGLNNRRALDKFIGNQLQKGERSFSVLMCDVDKFKSVNDTYGHLFGDEVLKGVANALKVSLGKSGAPLFLCRYGGDEFVVCGSDVSADTLDELAKIIHGEIAELNKKYPGKNDFSVSVGTSTGKCSNYKEVERLIHISDVYMYVQKAEK